MRELSLGNEGDFRRIYAVITATHRDVTMLAGQTEQQRKEKLHPVMLPR